jgi:putative FmdB family regulatory protein
MPIYEYTCQKCKAHIEVMQKVSDKPLARHSKCGGKLEKEWSRTGFQFKGTGWYVTDYAGRKSETKESSSTSKDGAKESDAKSAASETSASDVKSDSTATTETASKSVEQKKSTSKNPSKSKTSGD